MCPIVTVINAMGSMRERGTDQNTLFSTTILTVPGSLQFLVKFSCISMTSSSSVPLSSESKSSFSEVSSRMPEGDAEDLKIPDAAA